MTTEIRNRREVRPDPAGVYLRELLDIDFTDDQLAIATHDLVPQLIVAGAGSGKTAVMAARVVHAVAWHRIPAGRILGLTFTNKAAGELAVRVRSSLARLAGPDDAVEAAVEEDQEDDQPTVATYHSYAATIIRDHALRIGREPYTALLSEATQWQLATRVVRAAAGPFEHLPWTGATVATRVLALAGELSEHLVEVDAVRRFDADVIAGVAAATKPVKDVLAAAEAAAAREELLGLVEAYRRAKEDLDLIDYGDQVALAAAIARRAPVVPALERARFRLVVLDEYQDTGVAQRVLLATLFGDGHAVTAVGDPNQAIYGWRGASFGNLVRFGRHFPRSDGAAVTAQPLMTSFRCGGRILTAANAVASTIGVAAASRRPALPIPALTAARGAEDAGEVVVARLGTDIDEARWLAGEIAAELDAGTPAGEIAVLARRRTDFPRLHRALVDRDVPVEVVGLGGLLEMPEVCDVVSVLSLLVDATDNAAAIRLLTGPRWRFGIRDLAALGRRAAHLATAPTEEDEPAVSDEGLTEALRKVTAAVDAVDVAALLDAVDSPGSADRYAPEAFERLATFRAEIHHLRRLVGQPLVELVTEIVRTIGLDVEIEAETEHVAVARAANLAAFVDEAARFVGLQGESDVAAFLGYLAAAADAENGLDVGAVSTADTVKLMTVHKAKGLEWDVVAVPTLVDDVFPSGRGRTLWTRGAHVLPSALRGDCDDLPRLAGYDGKSLKAFKAACDEDEADEERRLAYVAFTRARRRLLVSGYCWAGSRVKPCQPSPYLEQLHALDAVVVDCWCDEPADDMTNPLHASGSEDVVWPEPLVADVLARRRAAAELVRDAMAQPGTADLLGADRSVRAEPADGPLEWEEEALLLLAEARAERSGVRDVPLPRRLTASQVVALAHDPDGLAASLARPMPVQPVRQARRGSRFHAWVESLYGTTSLLDADDLPGAGDEALDDAELAELQARFVADGWADRRPVAVEQPFELVVGGRLVRGRIDAVYPGERGGYDVIDYKTGSVPRDFAAASLQLSVYRIAWAELTGVDPAEVAAGFLYVRDGTVKRPDRLLSRDELAALLTT
jgi:DNA helicase-2/ATP-dependent DNA helicase PcrA